MYSIGKRDCLDCRNKRTLVYSRILKLEPTPGAGPRYIRDVMMLSLASHGSGPEVWRVEIVLTGLQLGVDIPARLGGGSHPTAASTLSGTRGRDDPAGKAQSGSAPPRKLRPAEIASTSGRNPPEPPPWSPA